jgi:hypothetical protein
MDQYDAIDCSLVSFMEGVEFAIIWSDSYWIEGVGLYTKIVVGGQW